MNDDCNYDHCEELLQQYFAMNTLMIISLYMIYVGYNVIYKNFCKRENNTDISLVSHTPMMNSDNIIQISDAIVVNPNNN